METALYEEQVTYSPDKEQTRLVLERLVRNDMNGKKLRQRGKLAGTNPPVSFDMFEVLTGTWLPPVSSYAYINVADKYGNLRHSGHRRRAEDTLTAYSTTTQNTLTFPQAKEEGYVFFPTTELYNKYMEYRGLARVARIEELPEVLPVVAEEGTFVCADCNNITTTGPNHATDEEGDEIELCDDCISDYHECECCNSIRKDVRLTSAEEYICEPCYLQEYFTCYHCSEVFHDDDGTHIDCPERTVCLSCYEDNGYFICDGCGQTYSDRFYGNDGYCEDCDNSNNENDEESSEFVRSYSKRAEDAGVIAADPNGLLLGVELEIECLDSYSFRDKAEQVHGLVNKFAILKEDGSLNHGFEIVTLPMDYENQLLYWKAFFAKRPKGLKSYDTETCGIHIHLTKKWLEDRNLLPGITEFIHKAYNKPFVEFVAQRRECNWAKYYPNKKTARSESGGRYEAINFNTSTGKTIEFRIFKGTLKESSFLKNLEFIYALVEYVQASTDMRYYSFRKWIATGKNRKKYPNLHAFIKDYKRGKEINNNDD